MRRAIFPGLAHKRLIRALQTYLHCEGLPLNTSQGLINVLFKSCAPITNWLEPSASSITQKRPLQIKIHMIYTWKALKGISSLLISHKCFKHPNFCSWFEEKRVKKTLKACQCLCVDERVWVTLGREDSLEFDMCTEDRETHISPTGNQYQWGRNTVWSITLQSNVTSLYEAGFISTIREITIKPLCVTALSKTIVPIGRSLLPRYAASLLSH